MSQYNNKRSRAAYEKEEKQSYVKYGTPVEPADPNSRDKDAFLPVWKQGVVDERGRKRLHGAFQGGFSAGYFNTVGSKEGWAPSTFTSSRTNRAKVAALRPEDFMDDEDLAEAAADEERKLQREAESRGDGTTAEELANQGLTNTAALFEMLSTGSDELEAGKRLMQKMGWREGQGIGPKVRRKVRDQDGEEDFKTFLFAPDDVKIRQGPAKTDTKGLGYTGELKKDEDEEMQEVKPAPKPIKKPNVRLGMGVGVFNDDGEDDEDIYEIKPKSSYNKVMGGEKKKKGKAAIGSTAKPAPKLPGKHVFISKKDTLNKAKIRKCHDGKLPLPGFILTDEPLWDQSAKKYPLPEVEDDWVPMKLLSNPSKYEEAKKNASGQGQKPMLDIRSRGAMLGEEQLPGKSVFDFLTPAARERLAAASGKKNLPPARSEQIETGKAPEQKNKNAIPHLEKSVAENALKGFLPYGDDPGKRTRYRTFLEIKAGLNHGVPIRNKGTSMEDYTKELQEFAHAARIFKPVTGLMANRFTSSSSTSSQLPTTGGSQNLGAEETLISRPAAKAEDPALTAAKMGMYGAMTRSTIQFYPTRLLCKRFNVAPPVHVDPVNDESFEGGGGIGARDVELVNKAEMNRLMIEANTNSEWKESRNVNAESMEVDMGGSPGDAAGETMHFDEKEEEVDVNVNPALEAERAGEEVFKAIFGDDSDDEDED